MKFIIFLMLLLSPALAVDIGQWEDQDPAIREWYKSLQQPDNNSSCCGEADAYWADGYEVAPGGNYMAIITDDRDDAKLRRKHIPMGTKIPIPRWKMKIDAGNPTGHGVVFLNQSAVPMMLDEQPHKWDWAKNEVDGYPIVFCFVTPGGG